MARIKTRKLSIFKQDYLVYRYLWPNIEWAVARARSQVKVATPLVLDVGCGNKPYADLFEGCDYKGLDWTDVDAEPDIISDVSNIPLDAETVDIVFSTQVIEHVPDPYAMIRECHRVLKKPGGILILTGPFYWPLHEEPYDFHRFSKYGFENLLKEAGFSQWEIKADGGDWAQIFLSINLRLSGLFAIPFWMVFNYAGAILDNFFHRELSPSNYTIIAKI